jgi:large subunit ribosomal protein L25
MASQTYSIAAEPRDTGRKSVSRQLRRAGRVPGIIYGGKGEPVTVSFEGRELTRLWNTGTFQSHILMVSVNGKETRVIPRDVQLDPVQDTLVHVDLMRLEAGARVTVSIPVHFVNDGMSPGIKRGGVLNIVRHEIELSCPVDTIPEFLTIDLANLEINDSVHISAVKLPEGVRPTIMGRDFTIATIAPPSALKAEREEAAQAAAAAAAAPVAAAPAAGAPAAPGAAPATPAAGAKGAPAKAAPAKK